MFSVLLIKKKCGNLVTKKKTTKNIVFPGGSEPYMEKDIL